MIRTCASAALGRLVREALGVPMMDDIDEMVGGLAVVDRALASYSVRLPLQAASLHRMRAVRVLAQRILSRAEQIEHSSA